MHAREPNRETVKTDETTSVSRDPSECDPLKGIKTAPEGVCGINQEREI